MAQSDIDGALVGGASLGACFVLRSSGGGKMRKPTALIILDGFGLREETYGNAVAQAKKPNFDGYWNKFPHTTLTACGEAVGSSRRSNG